MQPCCFPVALSQLLLSYAGAVLDCSFMAGIGEPEIRGVTSTPQSSPPHMSGMLTEANKPMSMFHLQAR